ncbi:polymeric immunoglobulin receptor-like [Arapaima gigas]
MRNLQENDSGLYRCGVDLHGVRTESAPLNLTVTTKKQGVMTENWVSAETGGSADISCFYKKKHKDHVKHWCKGFTWSSCSTTVHSDSPHSKGEVSITDVPKLLLFTVTMRNLQQRDSGWYWCGVESDEAVERFAFVYLTVTGGTGVSPTQSCPSALQIILVSAGLLVLLLVPFVIKIWILHNKLRKTQTSDRDRENRRTPTATGDHEEVIYSSVVLRNPAAQRDINQPLTRPGDEVVYSSVAVQHGEVGHLWCASAVCVCGLFPSVKKRNQ